VTFLTFASTARSIDASQPAAVLRQTPSDFPVIARIAGGDELAMRISFARHRVAIFRFILRFVRDETLAEDILSEVFLDVWRQAGRYAASMHN
jgi:Sigma-70 region 2